MIAWSVIPFNEGWVLTDINIGILFIFAVAGLGSLWGYNGRLGF